MSTAKAQNTLERIARGFLVARQYKLSPSTSRVYMWLLMMTDKSKDGWGRVPTMAAVEEMADIGRVALWRARQQLEKTGLVQFRESKREMHFQMLNPKELQTSAVINRERRILDLAFLPLAKPSKDGKGDSKPTPEHTLSSTSRAEGSPSDPKGSVDSPPRSEHASQESQGSQADLHAETPATSQPKVKDQPVNSVDSPTSQIAEKVKLSKSEVVGIACSGRTAMALYLMYGQSTFTPGVVESLRQNPDGSTQLNQELHQVHQQGVLKPSTTNWRMTSGCQDNPEPGRDYNTKPEYELWTIPQWAGFYWLRASYARHEMKVPLQMPSMGKLCGTFKTLLGRVPIERAYQRMRDVVIDFNIIRKQYGNRANTFCLDETTPIHPMIESVCNNLPPYDSYQRKQLRQDADQWAGTRGVIAR